MGIRFHSLDIAALDAAPDGKVIKKVGGLWVGEDAGGGGIYSIIDNGTTVEVPEGQQLLNVDGFSLGTAPGDGGIIDGEGSYNQLDLDRHFSQYNLPPTAALQILPNEIMLTRGAPALLGTVYGGGVVGPVEPSPAELLETLGLVVPEGHFLIGGSSPMVSADAPAARTALDVYSTTETDTEISTAIAALPPGTLELSTTFYNGSGTFVVGELARISGSTGGAYNLPASPSDGDRCGFIATQSFSGNGVTINGNGTNIQLFNSSVASFAWRIGAARGLEFIYSSNEGLWFITGGDIAAADGTEGLVLKRDEGYTYAGHGSLPGIPWWSSALTLSSLAMTSYSIISRVGTSATLTPISFVADQILARFGSGDLQAQTITAGTMLGRPTAGSLQAMNAAAIRTLISVEFGADVTDTTNVNAAGAVMETDFNANTVLAATSDDTPVPVTLSDYSVLGKAGTGAIGALGLSTYQVLGRNGSDVGGLAIGLYGVLGRSGADIIDFSAVTNSFFARVSGGAGSLEFISCPASRIVGRKATGDIGAMTAAETRTLLSKNEVLTPAQITSNQTGYNPTGLDTAERVRLSSDASRDMSGIAAAAATLSVKRLYNVGGFDIVLKHEDATETTAANRLLSYTGADITLQPGDNIEIWYDSITARWRLA